MVSPVEASVPDDHPDSNSSIESNTITRPEPGVPVMNDDDALLISRMSEEEYRLAENKLLRKMDLRLIPWMT